MTIPGPLLLCVCMQLLNECLMLKFSATDLAARPTVFRYLYYILTSFNPRSFRSWQKAGEPNPFVQKTYRQQVTERVEFVDIFGEDLKARRPRSKQP